MHVVCCMDFGRVFTACILIQVKKISSIPKKRGLTKFDSDFVDDDEALMQARLLFLFSLVLSLLAV